MSRRRTGWVPNQHGAWAMLVVPLVVGVLLRVRAAEHLPLFLLPLAAFWLLGYFAFNAASAWFKAAPARRATLVRPTTTYGAAAGALAVLTLVLAGPGVLGWVPVLVVLVAPALVLAARRRERATLGGGLTTAAASLMTLVVRFPFAADLAAWTPTVRYAVATTVLVFAYFFGTVLYVKTNIRERGNAGFYAASVAWHAAATATAVILAATLGSPPAWSVLFAAATVRAAVVPRLRPLPTPKRIGLLEIVFSLAICVIAALA